MRLVYAFNGDADGICALQQLRLADPRPATLVTGRKRDIALLERVEAAAGDCVIVLDVSLDANRAALLRLLERNVTVRYFDHHGCGEVPDHPRLRACIDRRPDTCTSLIVDAALAGAQRHWALVGAYGDGLADVADRLAVASGLVVAARTALHDLGTDLNYNAYGDRDEDLIEPPLRLAHRLHGVQEPQALRDDPVLARIRATRLADLHLALAQPVLPAGPWARACVLPAADWSRRIRGTLAHELAQRDPRLAWAVLTPGGHGDFVVSVRAPLASRRGADALCRRFGGEGRAAAAGIDRLPAGQVDALLAAMAEAFGESPP